MPAASLRQGVCHCVLTILCRHQPLNSSDTVAWDTITFEANQYRCAGWGACLHCACLHCSSCAI